VRCLDQVLATAVGRVRDFVMAKATARETGRDTVRNADRLRACVTAAAGVRE
jgi:hypothetical protein